MQCRQTQVPGFGKGHGVFHGFAVANLTHQNHIGRLAQGVFQRDFPTVGIQAHFALGDDAVFVRVHELHRVFYRDDVAKGIFVAPIDHGGQRGRFTRTGCSHQNHQTAFGHGNVFENLRQLQLIDGGDFLRNHPHHHTHFTHLHERIDTEAPNARRCHGKVALLGGFEFGHLSIVHDGTHQRQRMRSRQGLSRNFVDFAVHLDGGWKLGRDEQVTAIAVDHEFEQFVNELAGLVTIHADPSDNETIAWINEMR